LKSLRKNIYTNNESTFQDFAAVGCQPFQYLYPRGLESDQPVFYQKMKLEIVKWHRLTLNEAFDHSEFLENHPSFLI